MVVARVCMWLLRGYVIRTHISVWRTRVCAYAVYEGACLGHEIVVRVCVCGARVGRCVVYERDVFGSKNSCVCSAMHDIVHFTLFYVHTIY